jgi:5-methyltetrahydrofolate--homocysteine methyltransferase
MVHVAKEMERQGFTLPLMIGGATTSKQHTAVKIAPMYSHSTAHVLDASRAVAVVSALLDAEKRKTYDVENRKEQQRLRELFASKQQKPLVPYAVAREHKATLSFDKVEEPPFLGRQEVLTAPLSAIAKYIDWTFFFTAWEMVGKFPAILEHPKQGKAARELYADAQAILNRIIKEKLLTANAAYGFWPAAGEGDDIVLYTDEKRDHELTRFAMLRQQAEKNDGTPYRSLADYVGPKDYVGAFAVTAGLGIDKVVAEYEAKNDNYSAIVAKALADRLAEAFAEMLHARVRKDWYSKDEDLSYEELIVEKYRGIRPAIGYPACPDHTEKRRLFELLEANKVGIALTESCMMTPGASVSGLYFANPDAKYFAVGRVGKDQVEDYARRKGMSLEEAERWLGPVLGY